MNGIDVSIIYVNWNSGAEILASVESIRELSTGCSREIIVVDNNTPDSLAPLENQPDVRLIRNPVNAGFGSGCNLGAGEAKGRYILFLNPDTVLRNDVPGILFRFLESRPDCAVCGGMLLNSDGTVNYSGGRRCHSMLNDIFEHSSLCFRFPTAPIIGRPYYGDWDHRSTRAVECLCGACMMFRREAFEDLGGFDERFFMYCEEMDLCLRIKRKGLKVYYVHEAVLVHAERKSSIQYFAEDHRVTMQLMNSEAIYFRKNHGRLYAGIWRRLVGIIYGLKYVLHRRPVDLEKFEWGFKRV